jgi:hypothetical protein
VPTTATYFYSLEIQEDGRFLVAAYGPEGPYSIGVSDAPLAADEEGELVDDPLDDLSVLGDRPMDLAQLSGDVVGGALVPYAGTLAGDSSAIVFGVEGGSYILLSDIPYEVASLVTLERVDPVTGANGYDLVGDTAVNVTCYVAGTRVLTARGEVAVEALSAGEGVVTFSGRGPVLKPLRWVGRRQVDIAAHAEPWRVRPVRIRAGALAEGVPHRDLLVSPEHGLLLDGALVHAKTLVNGASVVQEAWDAVTYLHLDLGCHDVVLAEGALAESYLNEDGRAGFDNARSAAVVALRAGAAPGIPAYAPCAPFLRPGAEGNPALLAIMARLMERAEALGWTRTREAAPRLLADGRWIEGEAEGGAWRFPVPAGTGALRLVSRVGRPCGTVPGSTDGRWLGLQLRGMEFTPLDGGTVSVPLDHPGLVEGFSHPERRDGVLRRWTTGEADLTPALGPLLGRGGVLGILMGGSHASWVGGEDGGARRAGRG